MFSPRHFVAQGDGLLHVYNGVFDPYLSTYDSATGAWSHETADDWSTVNVGNYGGLARNGDTVFVTDVATARNPGSGVIAFDLGTGSTTTLAPGVAAGDLTLGSDGLLWVLRSGGTDIETAVAFDPITFESRGSVSLGAAGTDSRSIAVDANGDFFIASWSGDLVHLSATGAFIKSLDLGNSLYDVALASDGSIVVGSRTDGSWITDRDFSTPLRLEGDRWNSFVAFVVPEPSTGLLVLLGTALVAGRRRRVRSNA
ncbi:MAG: PEP-CTERM sorting domain-containing protein [Myxococcota bacterium]